MFVPSVTAWLGPVNLAQVGGSIVPGSSVVNVTCCGAPDPQCPPTTCPDYAASYLDAGGRRLPGLLASKGLDPRSVVAAGAFSAGGSILKRLCLNAADRAQLAVVFSSDASYEATPGTHSPVEGYALYMQDALSNPSKLFVATASASPNKTFGSGIDIITATRRLVEQRTGRAFALGGVLPGVDKQPAQLWRLGDNVWIAEYPDVPHGGHPTQLAPQVWRGLVLPWLAGAGPGPGPGPEPLPEPDPGPVPAGEAPSGEAWGPVALVAGLVAGYAGVRAWRGRGRGR
jgi:hypothetical protein